MNERILKIMAFFQLTQTEFARKMKMGSTSNLSHILSNRHKPSSEFFEKLLLAYPEISLEWVLTGKGEMFKGNSPQLSLFQSITEGSQLHSEPLKSTPQEAEKLSEKPDNQVAEGYLAPAHSSEVKSEDRTIYSAQRPRHLIKIIMVYSDRSFEELNPGP